MVLAVTVLTSLSDADLSEIGVSGHVITQVLRLGSLARNAGCGGLVASAKEARELRRELGNDFAIVTPGVRPAGTAVGDQARVLTPKRSHRRWSDLPGGRETDPGRDRPIAGGRCNRGGD